jgi:hypothetical protein
MPEFNVGDPVEITATHIPDYLGATAVIERPGFGTGSFYLRFDEARHRNGTYGNNSWGSLYFKHAEVEKKDGPPPPERWINVRVLGVVQEAAERQGTTPQAVIEEAFKSLLERAQRAKPAPPIQAREVRLERNDEPIRFEDAVMGNVTRDLTENYYTYTLNNSRPVREYWYDGG